MNDREIVRIIDANLNRAREALRVLEEYARFGKAPAPIFGSLRALRHEVVSIEGGLRLSPSALSDARDPSSDPGRAMPPERHTSAAGLVTANFRRLEEALRAVEEYGRLLGGDWQAASRARFDAYEIEKLLVPGLDLRRRLDGANLALALDSSDSLVRECAASLVPEGGVDLICLRITSGKDRGALELCAELSTACEGAGVLLSIRSRPDLAVISGAHGVHLDTTDMEPAVARRIVGWNSIVGVALSAISPEEEPGAADYAFAGQAFPGHGGGEHAKMGEKEIEAVLACPLPVFAACDSGPGKFESIVARGIRRAVVSATSADEGRLEEKIAGVRAILPTS